MTSLVVASLWISASKQGSRLVYSAIVCISMLRHAATLRTLNMALVRPHLEYAVPVWDPNHYKDIEALVAVNSRNATVLINIHFNEDFFDRRCAYRNPRSVARQRL